MRHGYSALTPQHVELGAGALYVGFTSPASLGTKIGATRGGNVFNYTPEVKDVGFDGAPGKVKGMEWITGASVTLEVNLLEITTDILKMSSVGMSASDYPAAGTKTHDLIKGSFTIAAAEYKNIAIVAEIKGKAEPLIVVVKNTLANSPLSLSFQDKDEAVPAITFEGHFDGADLTELPFEIYNPVDDTSGLVALDAPTFDPVAGSYAGTQTVDIAFDSDATLNEYSLDGIEWEVYADEVSVTESGTLYARSFATGRISSLSSAAYAIT